MIPNHILTDLKPDERVAILSQGNEIHFHVHLASDEPGTVRAFAVGEGAEELATHLQDHVEIRAIVVSRERDVGDEA